MKTALILERSSKLGTKSRFTLLIPSKLGRSTNEQPDKERERARALPETWHRPRFTGAKVVSIVARQRERKRERPRDKRPSSSVKALSLSLPLLWRVKGEEGGRTHRSSTVSRWSGRLTGSHRKHRCRLYLIKESGCHGNCEVNERGIDSAHLNSGQPLN